MRLEGVITSLITPFKNQTLDVEGLKENINFQLENGLVVPVYYSRNQDRIPDYHRIDVSYTIGQSYKRDQKVRTSWTISVYNIYGRRNAFSVFYTTAAFRQIEGKKLSILGNAFPSITFNIDI